MPVKAVLAIHVDQTSMKLLFGFNQNMETKLSFSCINAKCYTYILQKLIFVKQVNV